MKAAIVLYFHLLWLAASVLAEDSRAAPWQSYVQSPPSRTIQPVSVYRTTGNAVDVSQTKRNAALDTYSLTGPNSSITFDFARRVAGYPTISFGNVNCTLCNTLLLPGFSCGAPCRGLGVAFAELKDYVGRESDNEVLFGRKDGTLFVPINANRNYTLPTSFSRGSYRYLTLSLGPSAQADMSVDIRVPQVHFDAAPNLAEDELQSYSGYFFSSDDVLNQIWYSGAYTNQLCTIGANSSVQHTRVLSSVGWSNDAVAQGLTGADVFLADGAKRDRNPWAGDLDVALKSAIVSVNYDNLVSVRNTLRECMILQDSLSGFFPYAGSPLGNLLKLAGSFVGIDPYGSDTYHLWTIANFADYVIATGDKEFGKRYWDQIAKGISATFKYIDTADGLYNGTKTADWARYGQGGKNIALNAIYYHALLQSVRVATYLCSSDAATLADYLSRARRVKESINTKLWDPSAGLYFDNTTTAGRNLFPNDGNIAAINFNLTQSRSQSLTIAQNIASRLTKFGSVPPELPGSVSPFVSSQELRAQFAASPNDSSRALNLLRTQWGYMIKAFGNSTLVEGYGANGSIDYQFYTGSPAFVSAAHAWSTGPTYSLLASVVGLRANPFDVGADEGDWAFQPCAMGSGLTHAQGGFSLHTDEYSASWNVSGQVFVATLTTPVGTRGTVHVPGLAGSVGQRVQLDGKPLKNVKLVDGFFRLDNVSGGTHSIRTT